MTAKNSSLAREAAHTERIVGFSLLVLAALLLGERFGSALPVLVRSGFTPDTLAALAAQAIRATPEAFYLLALLGVRDALAALARLDPHSPIVAPMLERVGLHLAAGGFIGVLLVPGALRLAGADPGYWIAFDISGWALGLLGLALRVIARVLRQASVLRTELDGIF